MKKKIRLTESQLTGLIKKSVKKIINEGNYIDEYNDTMPNQQKSYVETELLNGIEVKILDLIERYLNTAKLYGQLDVDYLKDSINQRISEVMEYAIGDDTENQEDY